MKQRTVDPAAATKARPSLLTSLMTWTLVVFMVVPPTIFTYVPPTPAGMPGGGADQVMPTEGSAVSRMIWLALLGLGVGLTVSKSGKALKLLRETNRFLLVFYALVALSMLWSIEPGITVKRLVTASTIALVGIALTLSKWHYTRFQSVFRPVLTLLLMGSIIFVLAAPTMAIEQSSQLELVGAWHGLTSQKNALGGLAGVTFVLWWHGFLTRESRAPLAIAGLAIAGVCLVCSRSSTSIMAAVFSALLLLMMLRSPPALRRYLPYLIAVFVIALLIYSLAVLKLVPGSDLLLSPITALTGKDQTFSGRTAIWAILNEHIAQRPLLGSGYGAYWVQTPGSPSMIMLQRLYFYPTEGHNGYLDVIDDLGMVGGIVLFGYLITFLRQGLKIFSVIRTQGALYLTLLFLQMICNLSESRWFNALDINFVFMTIATVSMGKTLLDMRTVQGPRQTAPSRAARRR